MSRSRSKIKVSVQGQGSRSRSYVKSNNCLYISIILFIRNLPTQDNLKHWDLKNTESHIPLKQLSLIFHLAWHSIFNGGKFMRVYDHSWISLT